MDLFTLFVKRSRSFRFQICWRQIPFSGRFNWFVDFNNSCKFPRFLKEDFARFSLKANSSNKLQGCRKGLITIITTIDPYLRGRDRDNDDDDDGFFFYEWLVVHCTTWSWYWESKSCNLITALICNRGREREMQQSLQRINSKYQTLISHRTSKSFRSCSSSTSSMRTATSSSVRARLSPCQLPSFKLSKGTRSNRAGAQICYFC